MSDENGLPGEREDGPPSPDQARIRLAVGDGGPKHRRQQRSDDRERRSRLIAAAIEQLEREEPASFPDVIAIVEAGSGQFSRNRVYDEADLMYAAQSRWNEREEAAGRPPRKLRGGDRAKRADWVPAIDHAALNAKLTRALEEVGVLKERNLRLSKENVRLAKEVERLQLGVYDELWPTIGSEIADYSTAVACEGAPNALGG